jgi:hypothetical protein
MKLPRPCGAEFTPHHTTTQAIEENTLRQAANDNAPAARAAIHTTKSGRQYRTVRKITDYVGSKARYADVALPVLPSEVAA